MTKGFKKAFVLVLAMLMIISTFPVYVWGAEDTAAGENEKQIESVSVIPPAKLIYAYGEALDLTGGKLRINYVSDDGYFEEIDLEPSMISGYDENLLGNQTLTVTYEKLTGTFDVSVRRAVSAETGSYSVSKIFDGSLSAGNPEGELAVTGVLDEDKDFVEVKAEIGEFESADKGQSTVNIKLSLIGERAEQYVLEEEELEVPAVIYEKEIVPVIEVEDAGEYTGEAKEPIVTVKDGEEILSDDQYSIAYENNVEAGTAEVSVFPSEMANYIWEPVTVNFDIAKAEALILEDVNIFEKYNVEEEIKAQIEGIPENVEILGYHLEKVEDPKELLKDVKVDETIGEITFNMSNKYAADYTAQIYVVAELKNYADSTACINVIVEDDYPARIISGVENTTVSANSKLGTDYNIEISWKKSGGYKVDYYEIWRASNEDETFEKVAETDSGAVLSFADNMELKDGEQYYYQIRGAREIEGNIYYTKRSSVTDTLYSKNSARLAAGVAKTTIDASSRLGAYHIKVSWEKSGNYKMDYYEVYRTTSKDSWPEKPFYTTKSGSSLSVKNSKNLEDGKRYYYKVRGVRELNGEKYYSEWSDITSKVYSTANAKIISGVEKTTLDASSRLGAYNIKVSWKKTGGYKMDEYEVYRSTSKTGTYKKIYTTKSGSTLSVKNSKNLINGKRYYYKVRGVRVINGYKYYTKWSDITSTYYNKNNAKIISGVENTSVSASTQASKGAITVSWKKRGSYKMDYYQVYCSTSKNFGTTPAYTTKSGVTASVKNKNLKKGKRYYYKVRGVRVVNGYKYYSEWSNVTYKTVK